MEIGDAYSDGIITDMEMDNTKVFWIKIQHRNGGYSIVNFDKPKDLLPQAHSRNGKGVRLTVEEYAQINEVHARLTADIARLEEENAKLKKRITGLLNQRN